MSETRPLPSLQIRGEALAPGLYLVATPIGSARDITLRALDILANADVIAAEDTRTTRHLMDLHGIRLEGRPLWPYHDHNGAAARPRLLAALADGRSVAYCSEAGTPVVADPGFQLVKEAVRQGAMVTTAPGPSAAIAALTVAGLPTDRFLFAGFAPSASGARQAWIAELSQIPATLILYESPKRIHRLLKELCEAWGDERPAVLCRELTKRFEDVRRGTLRSLCDGVEADPPRGEIVLLVQRGEAKAAGPEEIDAALTAALASMRVKDAARSVAEALDLPRRDVYQRALALKDGENKS